MIGFLTRLIKQSVDSLNEDKREDNIASIKEEIDDIQVPSDASSSVETITSLISGNKIPSQLQVIT